MRITRRTALRSAAAATAAATIVPSTVFGKNAPSERITLGFIGMGGQGVGMNLNNFLSFSDGQAVTVCDVVEAKSARAAALVDKRYKTKGCKAVADFREILADKAIDAVVISTPDHWHVPISLMALEAGKDVFSEKPTLTIAEGRALVNEVNKRKAVFQMGIEDRSVIHYHKMVEWLRNGAIGDLVRVDLQLPGGFVFPKEKPVPVPKGLNYEMFVGPAEFIPYTPHRTVQKYWRMTRQFANGSLVDWGSHQFDTAQLAVNDPDVCPVEVEGTGEIPKDSFTTVPVKFGVKYRYGNGAVVQVTSGGTGIRLTGTKGWVGNDQWRGQLKASDAKILRTKYTPETSKHWPMPPGEQRNFLDCVKSRKPTTYPAEVMHYLHTSLHMGIISIRLGRKLTWNPRKEEFLNDEAANALRSRPVREDWKKKA